MDIRIRILTIGGALALLLLVVDLVRRRKLKEEYSVLWVVIGVLTLLVSVWFAALRTVTNFIGAISPASTLFFFGLLFCLVLLLHFSVRISALERRLTTLVQEVGLMAVQEPADDAVPAPAALGHTPEQSAPTAVASGRQSSPVDA